MRIIMAENTPEDTPNFIELAGDITIAWLQNPNVNPGIEDVPAFLRNVHAAIAGLTSAPAPEPEAVAHEPAASVRGSVKADYLVSLIDGKKYKTLKRHLAANGLTPTTIASAMDSNPITRWSRRVLPKSGARLRPRSALAASAWRLPMPSRKPL
jgi:predicted transcriptional regulator